MRPIIGTEVLANGTATRGALRWNYTAVHPTVYLPNGARRTLYTNTWAAWLWTARKGIVAGRAAAALYGVDWIDDTVPVELIARSRRDRRGVIIRDERIGSDEIRQIGRLVVTSPARTALDLARHLPRDAAVAHLDALARHTGVSEADIAALDRRYPGIRGIRQAREAVALMDGGAWTPEQTQLRLLLIDAGLPRPRTAVKVSDGTDDTILAMGWDGPKVGVDYGSAGTAEQSIARSELVQRCGWFSITVLSLNARMSVIHRVRTALRRRA